MKDNDPISTLSDIKQMMEKSNRFISLSGLSGVAAGIIGLLSGIVAYSWFPDGLSSIENESYNEGVSPKLLQLIKLAIGTFFTAVSLAIYFTVQKSRKLNLPSWSISSKRLVINLLLPLIVGGLFIVGLLQYPQIGPLLIPSCLVFYGLSLVNASKYTLGDIRSLGIIEIILGLINILFPSHGLLFWIIGFGCAHIVYGVYMWNKYDRIKQ